MEASFKSLTFIYLFIGALAMDELVVLYSPPAVSIISTEPLRSSRLADFYSSILGYTVSDQQELPVAPFNPLKRPEAILNIDLLDSTELPLPPELAPERLPLENEGDLEDQFDTLVHRTVMRFPDDKKVVALKLDTSENPVMERSWYPELLQYIRADGGQILEDKVLLPSTAILNLTLSPDLTFLREMANIRAFLAGLEATQLKKEAPNLFWLHSKGLAGLVEAYGANSPQVVEASRLQKHVISQAVETMRQKFADQTLVTLTRQQELLQRHTRAAPEEEKKKESKNPHNVAHWEEGFHAAFMTLAFVTVGLVLAVAGVILGLMSSDMGRDSIIYRSSGARLKRD